MHPEVFYNHGVELHIVQDVVTYYSALWKPQNCKKCVLVTKEIIPELQNTNISKTLRELLNSQVVLSSFPNQHTFHSIWSTQKA